MTAPNPMRYRSGQSGWRLVLYQPPFAMTIPPVIAPSDIAKSACDAA